MLDLLLDYEKVEKILKLRVISAILHAQDFHWTTFEDAFSAQSHFFVMISIMKNHFCILLYRLTLVEPKTCRKS